MNPSRRMAMSMDGQTAHSVKGIISSVNPADYTVKVTLWGGTDGEKITGWIPCGAVAAAGGAGFVCPPVVGEQVHLEPELNSDDNYTVTARVFSTRAMPPVSPGTGKVVLPGEIGAFVTAEPGGTEIGAYWHLSGSDIYTAGTWRHVGTLDSTGDVVAAGVSVQEHEHDEVKSGSDTTGKPVPGSAS